MWRFWVATLSASGLLPLLPWQECKRLSCTACYRAFQTTTFVFLFSFEKVSGASAGRETRFGHIALKLKPAVSQERQGVVIFVLLSFADMDAGWNCKKGQGKKVLHYQRKKNGERKHKRNVSLFTFQLYCWSWREKRILVVLLTSSEDCSGEALTQVTSIRATQFISRN